MVGADGGGTDRLLPPLVCHKKYGQRPSIRSSLPEVERWEVMAYAATVSITVTPAGSPAIRCTVTLQLRSDHSAANVTATGPGFDTTVSVASDGSFEILDVPDGTYTLTASAPGYLSAELAGVVVAGSEVTAAVTVPAAQLKAGDIDNSEFININDITGIVASFGTSVKDCADDLGRFVDLDCGGFVNINDITGAISNFGLASPQPW